MADGRVLSDALSTDPWMRQRQQQLAGRSEPGVRTASYFGYQPEMSAREEQELRRQQLETHRRVEAIDRDNQWMLIPIFAPELAIAGAEISGALLGRAVAKRLANMKPLELGPIPPSGNKLPVVRGVRAHNLLTVKARSKPGWDAGRRVQRLDGDGYVLPDIQTPVRNPELPKKRFNLELKPDTLRGRQAGARQAKMYEQATGNKTRVIYYDPKKFVL